MAVGFHLQRRPAGHDLRRRITQNGPTLAEARNLPRRSFDHRRVWVDIARHQGPGPSSL